MMTTVTMEIPEHLVPVLNEFSNQYTVDIGIGREPTSAGFDTSLHGGGCPLRTKSDPAGDR